MEMGIREAIDNLYIIATNEDSKKARDIEGYYEKCFDRVIEELDTLEENINKLINYIAVRENKDYEDTRKEFDI